MYVYVCCQCAENQPQSAVFLPEFALSPQGSFMEDATEDQFLTYRYDDQVSHTLSTVAGPVWVGKS